MHGIVSQSGGEIEVESEPARRHVPNQAAAHRRADGPDVIAAPNAATAVELAATTERRVDLLLTDVVMPGMRGGEVAARITQLRPGTPVLSMSGYADELLLGDAAGGVLQPKPFSAAELADAVADALAAAAAR